MEIQRAKYENKWLWIIFIVFGMIFCDISLLNHYLFRTTALDLGLYNHLIYKYAHFKIGDYTVDKIRFSNHLSDHFELYPALISPLYWIFGSYTMLIFQIGMLLLGGLGVYKFILLYSENKWYARASVIHFFSLWGIYSALAFDYHNNVAGAMLVPWLFYYFKKSKYLHSSVIFILLLISKENIALWGTFISLGLLLIYHKETKKAIISLGMAGFSLLYFFIVVKWVMPSLGNHIPYLHFQFTAIGNDFSQAVHTIFTKPLYTFDLLLQNHLIKPEYSGLKLISHSAILLSGGYIFFYRPKYFLMLLPIYGQKFFNDDPAKWGVYWHYSIELAPILTIGLFTGLLQISKNASQLKKETVIAIFITIIITFVVLQEKTDQPYNSATHRFYSYRHYSQPLVNVKETYSALSLIPQNASVSAQSVLVPHLSFRDKIYEYPNGQNCDYLVFMAANGGYSMDKQAIIDFRRQYHDSTGRDIIYDKDNMLIIKKKHTSLL